MMKRQRKRRRIRAKRTLAKKWKREEKIFIPRMILRGFLRGKLLSPS
jgi:hypothetical protein